MGANAGTNVSRPTVFRNKMKKLKMGISIIITNYYY